MNGPLDDKVDALDPVLAQMSHASEAECWRLTRITPREKVFFSVVADACQSTLGLPFEHHVNTGLRHGVTMADIREVLRLVSFDCGYHVAIAAMQRLAELERASNTTPVDVRGLASVIKEAAASTENPLPAFARSMMNDLGEHFTGFMGLQARMRRDPRMSATLRERQLTMLTVDVLYQTLGGSFRIHATRAMNSGADRETLREAVWFSAQFGATRTWNALQALNTLFAQLDSEAASGG